MMHANALSPYIRVALDSRIAHPWTMRERVLFDYELLYVKEGEAQVTIGDDRFTARPGDLLLFRPGVRHAITTTRGPVFHQPHLHFDLCWQPDSADVKVSFMQLEDMTERERGWIRPDLAGPGGFGLPDRIRLRNPRLFEEMLYGIIREKTADLPYAELRMKGQFLDLWTFLLRNELENSQSRPSTGQAEMARIRERLEVGLENILSLNDLAAEFHISKYHLVKRFQTAFQTSPMQYRRDRRMQRIRELVQYTDQSLGEIADQFGFSSQDAFSRAFRKADGVPPSWYRRR